MADCVDAAVDAMKASVSEPALDRVAIGAGADKLAPRDPPVLAPCNPGDDVELAADTGA